MQSTVKLHLRSSPSPILTTSQCYGSNSMLNAVPVKEFFVNEERIRVQSISSYFAHIELFEYSFTRTAAVDFSVTETSYFMYADIGKNSCYLCYCPAGKYRKKVKGSGQIILITFKPDWLTYKCRKLPGFMPFTESLCSSKNTRMRLPSAGIARNLFKSLQKMDAAASESNPDDEAYFFINGCLNKYHNSIKCRNATSHYHHHKAQAIATFIAENFSTKKADDLSYLTSRFMVSERSLARLAKMAFGIALHEQVIKLRMEYGKHLLSTTNKAVKQVALLCGYSDAHYFGKAFKKYYGQCPKTVNSKQLSACH